MLTRNLWISLGTAIAASKAARTLTHLTANDVLGTVGLERRRNTTLENVALVGIGALVGAGAALLFAPTSGPETRQRVAAGLGKARERGRQLVDEAKERAPELVDYAKSKIRDFEELGQANQRSYES